MTEPHPALRPQIAALPAYVPGERPATGPTPAIAPAVVKLSSNENPYLPLPAVVEAIGQAAREVNRYPDMASTALVAALAQKCGVEPGQVAVDNGSVALLETILLAVLRPGDEVVYPWRSFEAYPIAVAVAGGVAVPVPITADGRHNVEALTAALSRRTRVVILCSPNNPTGPALSTADFEALMDAVPPEVVVVLDEAYVEYVRDPLAVNGLAQLGRHPNLISLRTLSKAYGLAGLRVGYALGSAALMAGVRATATPFGVNRLAQAAAVASLQPAAERVLSARVAAVVAERTRVAEVLGRQGFQVPDAQGNFVWLPLGESTEEFAAAARDAGLLVRAFPAAPPVGRPAQRDDTSHAAGSSLPAPGEDSLGESGLGASAFDPSVGVRVTIADGEGNNQFLFFADRWAREHGMQGAPRPDNPAQAPRH